MVRYRLYLDESGDHTYGSPDSSGDRYLALTGILIHDAYYRSNVHPQFERLKQLHFPHNPDDPVVLVRSRIIGKRGPFGRLSDPVKRKAWEDAFVNFIQPLRMMIFTVVIDKLDHLATYGEAADHPYHYCLTVLLERLAGYLRLQGGIADVMAESRGGKEDKGLQRVYKDVYGHGTYFQKASLFQQVLSSKEMKFRKKDHNIAGLQLADCLAAPSKLDVMLGRGRTIVPGLLATSKSGTHWEPRDQGLDGGLVSSLRALL